MLLCFCPGWVPLSHPNRCKHSKHSQINTPSPATCGHSISLTPGSMENVSPTDHGALRPSPAHAPMFQPWNDDDSGSALVKNLLKGLEDTTQCVADGNLGREEADHRRNAIKEQFAVRGRDHGARGQRPCRRCACPELRGRCQNPPAVAKRREY